MTKSSFLAIFILAGMMFLMIESSRNDSATFDEIAHIGAGYSYLKEKDGRLNPEHPPLVKILSAVPLLFLKLNFSINQPFWTAENVNDRQWAAGNSLLYESGNDLPAGQAGADKILFWSRFPIMALAVLFGFFIFWWARKNYGAKTAIFSLLLFALSPTFLAHSRLVTTDVGAAFAFFASIVFFLKFLENNNKKSAVYFGLVFGLSLLVKFSLVILIPFFAILTAGRLRFEKIQGVLTALFIALAVIYIFYIPLVWSYPLEQNLADARYTLGQYKTAQFAPKFDFWLLSNQITRPLGQYLHGFLMAAQRTAGGNSAYFLGEISSEGWTSYFPVLFFAKEQIGLYLLMLIAIIVSINPYPSLRSVLPLRKGEKVEKIPPSPLRRAEGGLGGLGVKWIFLAFIAYYWTWSLWSPLNIGIRHILPTFPFIYILVSQSVAPLLNKDPLRRPAPTRRRRGESVSEARRVGRGIFIFAIFLWMAVEIALVFPYFISYYNEFSGGFKNGYRVATDSNYDWGQDLKRLKFWAEENKIDKIYIDYFGGGSPKYYLGDKYEFWRYEKGPPPFDSAQGKPVYFAVSANSLVGAEKLYYWLEGKKPIARAGSSIFIFSF